MPLDRDAIRNEHLKHVANWFNALATGVAGAGTFVPAAQYILGMAHALPAGCARHRALLSRGQPIRCLVAQFLHCPHDDAPWVLVVMI
jgi:hypothetical protein